MQVAAVVVQEAHPVEQATTLVLTIVYPVLAVVQAVAAFEVHTEQFVVQAAGVRAVAEATKYPEITAD